MLLILVIAVVVILILLLIGYTYLGRYVVYTEDGAYFSFHDDTGETSRTVLTVPEISGELDLVTGEPISAGEVSLGITSIADTDVRGVLVDNDTLQYGATLGQIELGSDSNNTLVMEMRATDSPMLDSDAIRRLISRAKTQEVHLVAMIACLSDSDYALEHPDLAVQITGGALWMGSLGSYWLDPGQDEVISYVTDMILELADMGFDEVLLDDFYIPVGGDAVYDSGGVTLETVMTRAYNNLVDATIDFCQLSLLISDPDNGHQAMAAADRIYVEYDNGSTVADYAENHPDQYLVFITESHDTRFDSYGRIEAGADFTVTGMPVSAGESEESGEDGTEDETEDAES